MKNIIFLLALLSASAFAVDYSAMTTTELQAMRGTVPAEDRAAYQVAVQKRMQTMTQEERQALTQSRTSNPATGNMGSNSGGTNGGGNASGSGMGGSGMGGNGKGGGRGGR